MLTGDVAAATELRGVGLELAPAALLGGGAGFLLRAAGLGLGCRLPGYQRSTLSDHPARDTSPK